MRELLGVIAVRRSVDMKGMIVSPIMRLNITIHTPYFLRAYKMDNYKTVILMRSVNGKKQASVEGSVEMVPEIRRDASCSKMIPHSKCFGSS